MYINYIQSTLKDVLDFLENYQHKVVLAIDDYFIEWTKDHTYYTQRLCNEVFSLSGNVVVRNDIVSAIQSILDSERDRFQEIRRLVTRSQWKKRYPELRSSD